jgi:hypothetical protein
MRGRLTRESLQALMQELARSVGRQRACDVYLVGGGTAVLQGWRDSSVDADLYSAQDEVFRDVQAIKDRLQVNIERARPEDFVPPLPGSSARHVFIETIGKVSFHHYDPCAQVLAKVARGFDRDLRDARAFLDTGMVNAEQLRQLVAGIPAADWARYPRYSPAAVRKAVEDFLAGPVGQ